MEDSFKNDKAQHSMNLQPGNSHFPSNVNHVNSPSSSEDDANHAWKHIRQAVHTSRRVHMSFATKVPHDFSFLTIKPEFRHDQKGLDGQISNRLLFLGILQGKRENELLYVNVPDQLSHQYVDNPVEWNPVVSMLQGRYPSYSREEELLRERKRVGIHGIASYEISQDNSRILFPAGGEFYYIDVDQLGRVEQSYSIRTGFWTTSDASMPRCLSFKHEGVKIDSKMSPSNCDLVAYVMNNDIWVKYIVTGDEQRLTFANRGNKSIEKEPISAGVTSYVIQEEFDRYTGYWWQPNTPKNIQRILYEEVDESDVQILHVMSPMSESTIDSYRYPRAGTTNAKVQLKLVEFELSKDGLITNSVIKALPQRLETLFPWMEYIVRVDWLSSGEGACVQLLDRPQQMIAVVYIPTSLFIVTSNNDSSEMNVDGPSMNSSSVLDGIKVLLLESNAVWISILDIYYFYNHVYGSNEISFIWSSERYGYRHLYRIRSKLNEAPVLQDGTHNYGTAESLRCRSTCQALTEGNWNVMEHTDIKSSRQLWVNEETNQIFFMGLRNTVLESHLYMVNERDPSNPLRLTQLGRSHIVSMNKNCSMFVTLSSCTNEMFSTSIYKVMMPESRPIMFVNLLEPMQLHADYTPPEIFSYKSESSGFKFYGMLYKPRRAEPGKKYPTVMYVYGGPRVQMVTNAFKGLRHGRIFTYTLLGYAVLIIDGRGSAHRGLQFEGCLKNQLGQVEVHDQVEGLHVAAEKFQCIDLERVAISGWSYGGYLSLMSLAEKPEVFKIAICGAPVTSWELYDTGYTERYIGTPDSNPEGYDKSSILKLAPNFPIQPNRLFLFHGVIDENVHFVHTAHLVNALIRHCKPYHLQVYPAERHGLRSAEGNEHYENIVSMYLHQYL